MNTEPVTIVAVIFPGFELLDLYGPLELFGMLGDRVAISVAAEKAGMVPSSQTPKGYADCAWTDARSADVLFVPGGIGVCEGLANAPLLEHLRRLAASARYVASVCTGSALLAKAGLLDGRKATSNKRALARVTELGPKVEWIRQARWVEDGRFFTASGVSAGMDMSLALIERLYGSDARIETAARAEYIWHEDSTADPFA
jgi:transcriptional regulator GlxA family with amidase domain